MMCWVCTGGDAVGAGLNGAGVRAKLLVQV